MNKGNMHPLIGLLGGFLFGAIFNRARKVAAKMPIEGFAFVPPVNPLQQTSEDCGAFLAPRPHCRLVLSGRAKAKYRHQGIDLSADEGDSVRSVGHGKVVFTGFQGKDQNNHQSNDETAQQAVKTDNVGAGGIMVFIDHGSGLLTQYMHLSEILCKLGDQVAPAELVAKAGDTGDARGAPHLHFVVKLNGTRVDPAPYLGLPPSKYTGAV